MKYITNKKPRKMVKKNTTNGKIIEVTFLYL